MPHQCLNCGEVFEEGSPYLLKGCPKCGGKRFFYIKEPLSEEERKKVKEEVESKIEEKFAEIFQKDLRDVKPEDVKRVFREISESREKFWIDERERKERIKKLLEEKNEEPETITIEEPGRYKLDLKSLLEEEIIIIQKDGSYTIHLPSLFSMVDKEKED
ncbi:MAG: hypothetical protein DRN18_05010 [Thermoplasmata archaeon]|nr:MAG: hypothetical protein DRN18_05010 [Thermoplasmata archaeon]